MIINDTILGTFAVSNASSVDDKVTVFNRLIKSLYDIHAPIKSITVKRPPAPWMSKGVRMAMRRRNRAFRKYRRDRSDENWVLYKSARNRCNQMIRNAKRRHILENITSTSAAAIWKFLGTLGIGKQGHEDLPNTIGLDDINRHFTTTPSLDRSAIRQTVEFITGLPRQRKLPSLWRKAYVRPLPKITNPTLPTHFRPISILPFLSKVLEACAHKQLSSFIARHNFISPLQSGFRPGHSTATALLKVTGDIREGISESKVTAMVLIDFSNAFNAVSHDILESILSYLMVSPGALDWFQSYLRERQQAVRNEETLSNWCELAAGVPQG
ncbi:uncharacterized protein LOC111363635, partial [Spodoptera litura]|uniref:Uncharacterized protein LOC111363635 n=1 Tax=Spodoptera litura TaxID=69820 RepID=A0A9J7EV51_SPOLT